MSRLTSPLLPILPILVLVAACSTPQPPPPPEVLAQLATCNLPRGVHLLGSLAELTRGLYGNRLPQPSTSPPVPGGFRALVVVGAERPTSGYALNLDGAEYAGSTLTLQISESEPPADAIAATVVTQPCLAIGMPQAGYDTVVVESGAETLATLSVTDKGRSSAR